MSLKDKRRLSFGIFTTLTLPVLYFYILTYTSFSSKASTLEVALFVAFATISLLVVMLIWFEDFYTIKANKSLKTLEKVRKERFFGIKVVSSFLVLSALFLETQTFVITIMTLFTFVEAIVTYKSINKIKSSIIINELWSTREIVMRPKEKRTLALSMSKVLVFPVVAIIFILQMKDDISFSNADLILLYVYLTIALADLMVTWFEDYITVKGNRSLKTLQKKREDRTWILGLVSIIGFFPIFIATFTYDSFTILTTYMIIVQFISILITYKAIKEFIEA